MPITEGCDRSFKLAGLLTGVECGIGSHKRGSDHNAKDVLSEHATLYLDKPQTRELEARGFVLSAKGEQSTKGVLKVHLEPNDHPESLAGLDDFQTGPAYEYAKRILLSCIWENGKTGSVEPMNFRINDKQLTSYKRARLALSIYEYAGGTMKMGEDASATRDDLYRYQKDRRISLGPKAGVACPGACGNVHHRRDYTRPSCG
jgi:hypothetical protein